MKRIIFYLLLLFLVDCKPKTVEEEAKAKAAATAAAAAASICRDTNCSNYTSQAQAQAAYNLDPKCRADLDQNKNGVVCEEPGNTVKTCQSTSNCGCSNKVKADCERDICCRWVVGTGCRCGL